MYMVYHTNTFLDEGPDQSWIEQNVHRVDRSGERRGVADQLRHHPIGRAVGLEELVASVHHDHGEGLVLREHALDGHGDSGLGQDVQVGLVEEGLEGLLDGLLPLEGQGPSQCVQGMSCLPPQVPAFGFLGLAFFALIGDCKESLSQQLRSAWEPHGVILDTTILVVA